MNWEHERFLFLRRPITATPFYPTSISRGRESTQTVDWAIRKWYTKGVSTRNVKDVLKEFGIENLHLPSRTI